MWDRYHIPDKGASFHERVPSASKPPVSPLCAVELHGGGNFSCAVGEGQPYVLGATYTTRSVSLEGCTPRWNETCELVCEQVRVLPTCSPFTPSYFLVLTPDSDS